MLKIAVCDDDRMFIQNTVRFITEWSDESGVPIDVFTYDSGEEMLSDKTTGGFNMIFLDILMPESTGIEVAKELRKSDSRTVIVFVTSSAEFALESYEVRARDYILKPVTYEKIKRVLDELEADAALERQTFVLKTEFGYQKLCIDDIEYAEAQNKKVIFYLKDGSEIESPTPLGSLENMLTLENRFFKCHRSYLVYIPNIERFNTTEIVTKSGRCIPIARGHAQTFKEAYFSLMFKR